jgi:MFS superfamily sulfate permease-like transporter
MTDDKNSAASAGRVHETWAADLGASLVVVMVALPLCIAIAQASGVPAEAGIITGILGGLVVGFLSGSPLQVSGPAAGLLVLVLDLVQNHGLAGLGVAVFLAGLLQIAAAGLRLGQWFRAVSPAVIHGMLAGIGLVIIAKQVHVLIDDTPADRVVENLLSLPRAAIKAFTDNDTEQPHHRIAAIVGLVTMLVLIVWKPLVPGRLKLIPAALVAVVAGSVVGDVLDHDIKTVAVENNLLAVVSWIWRSDRRLWHDPEVLRAAFSFGFIASAETLLCASAVDRMHSGPRTQFNRELSAQGVGNMLCGVLGTLPMTGVIVRSAANVEAGARTRLSTILHGAWLLLFVCLAPGLLRLIPLTSLAAILIVTGYRLLEPRGVVRLWRTSRSEALIFLVTAGTIAATDLLVGVLTGVTLSLAKLVWTFSHLIIRLEPMTDITIMRLEGAATFIRLPLLADRLERLPPDTELHVDFTRLSYIDHACLELLINWEKQHEATGGRLVIDWDSLHAKFHSPRTGPNRGGPNGDLTLSGNNDLTFIHAEKSSHR